MIPIVAVYVPQSASKVDAVTARVKASIHWPKVVMKGAWAHRVGTPIGSPAIMYDQSCADRIGDDCTSAMVVVRPGEDVTAAAERLKVDYDAMVAAAVADTAAAAKPAQEEIAEVPAAASMPEPAATDDETPELESTDNPIYHMRQRGKGGPWVDLVYADGSTVRDTGPMQRSAARSWVEEHGRSF